MRETHNLPLKMRKVVCGSSSNQCSPLRLAWNNQAQNFTMRSHRKYKYGPAQSLCRVCYLPLQAGDLVEFIKVLQTVAEQTQVKLCSVKFDRGALKLDCSVRQSPEHRSPWSVQSFESEEAVPRRHPGSVKSHQTIKLFEGDAHRPLRRKTAAGKAFDRFKKKKKKKKDQVAIIDRATWHCTCRLTNSWKAWSIAERLCSKRDLNFIFSTSLNVSKTTARSWMGKQKTVELLRKPAN